MGTGFAVRATSHPTAVVAVITFLFLSAVVSVIVGLTSLWAWGRRLRLRKFAAGEGITFEAGMAPIAVPQSTRNPPCRLRAPENFLYGSRRGVEVFACDFRKGEGRGSVSQSMVAVRGVLRDASGLDLRRWELLSLDGWAFLVPRNSATVLSRRKIGLAWDLLISAIARGGPAKD